jgi:hypothetical protein
MQDLNLQHHGWEIGTKCGPVCLILLTPSKWQHCHHDVTTARFNSTLVEPGIAISNLKCTFAMLFWWSHEFWEFMVGLGQFEEIWLWNCGI